MVYNYTKPRRPVAAEYSGPGPAYCLPSLVGQMKHDPRSVHNRGPAYHFGLKHSRRSDNCSPGPIYKPDERYFRTGKEQNPAYVLVGRPKDLNGGLSPGPLDYDTSADKAVLMSSHTRSPAYSFGLKHNDRDVDRSPGPAQYVYGSNKAADSTKRRSPCYPIVGRRAVGGFHEDLSHTPGPQHYSSPNMSTYLGRSPAYSITGRNTMPEDTTKKPGPWSHDAELVWVHKRQPPKFSFGIRHSQYAGTFRPTDDD